MSEELPKPGITAERTFRVEDGHATTLFGEQDEPPGAPAAADAGDDESLEVLGTPQLLASVEFLGRESLHGTLPNGFGVVGTLAEMTHRSAAPIGRDVLVRTELTDVTDRTLTIKGTLTRADSGGPVGEVTVRLRVVRRDVFTNQVDS